MEPSSADHPAVSTTNETTVHLPIWMQTTSLVRIALGLVILLGTVALLVLIWLAAGYFSSLLLIFFSAWLISLLLTPVVGRLIQWHIPKLLAIFLTFVLLIAVFAGFLLLVVPGLIAQTTALVSNLGPIFTSLSARLSTQLSQWGITLNLNQVSSQLQSVGQTLLQNLIAVAAGIASVVLALLLILIITALLLASQRYDTSVPAPQSQPNDPQLIDSLPAQWWAWITFGRVSFERNFGQFLRGQFIIALLYGMVTGLTLGIAGYNYAVTTGCICGLLMIIPFVGGPLSLVPIAIVTLSSNNALPLTIVVLVLLFVLQTLLLNVALPRIVGTSSGLGPVTTLFVLLAGAQIGGLFGALLAVPLVATFKTLVDRLIQQQVLPVATPVPITLPVAVAVGTDTTRPEAGAGVMP